MANQRPKSLVVCVEFDDFLAITLPRNNRHFEQTLVITSICDIDTQRLALENACQVFITDVFYENEAVFNKGAAIEKGLDILGRDGWLCLWDADIVMPSTIEFDKDPACLYTALRRTLDNPADFSDALVWNHVPITGHEDEFPGYFQLFNAQAAGPKPWFEVNWKHAGGYDGNFQNKFSKKNLCRPPFNVLHLGPSVDMVSKFHLRVGDNWCGRTTPRLDGKPLADQSRKSILQSVIDHRKLTSDVSNERI